MTFSCPTATWEEVLELARQHGYEGVEPRIESGHAHGAEIGATAEKRREMRKRAEDAGVAIACVATGWKLADPSGNIEPAKKSIDLAADLGSKRIRVFGGDFPKSQATDSLVNSLKTLGPHAKDHGVTVCLETHDAWCNPREVEEVMRRVDHQNVKVNWDITHTLRRGRMKTSEAYAVLRPWIAHTHVHDALLAGEKFTIRPMGSGDFDHREVIRLLKRDGYNGFISGEWMKECMDESHFASHLQSEIRTLRGYEKELEAR